MNVQQYIDAHRTNMSRVSQGTGISYTTLHGHVRHGKQLSLRTARRLAEWSHGEMTVADILGLPPAQGGPPRRAAKSRKAAACRRAAKSRKAAA